MIKDDILFNLFFMELSLFLAQVIGITFFIIGFGFLCNAEYCKKSYTKMLKNEGTVLYTAFVGLVIGSMLVLSHNIWEPSWVIIITVLGWMSLLKGFLLAIFPKPMIHFSSMMLGKTWMYYWAGVFYMILGGALLYFGFFA